MNPTPQTNSRGGFTLVELLVVIAIIGVLVALLLPAVQTARESANKSSCQNNLKQLALGMQGHLNARRTFPARGKWGIESGSPPYQENHHSWVTFILPYIEQQALASQINLDQPAWGKSHLNVPLSVLRCPSDGFFLKTYESRDLTITNYAGCEGMDWWRSRPAPAIGLDFQVTGVLGQSLTDRAPNGQPHTLKLTQITDGLSKTLLFGEVTSLGFFNQTGALDQMGDGVPGTPTRAYARAAFIDLTTNGASAQSPWKKADGNATGAWVYTEPGAGGSGPPGIGGPVFMTRGGVNSHPWGANSFHPGFIHVAMCDGSVRQVGETTTWRIWNLICSAEDARVINE